MICWLLLIPVRAPIQYIALVIWKSCAAEDRQTVAWLSVRPWSRDRGRTDQAPGRVQSSQLQSDTARQIVPQPHTWPAVPHQYPDKLTLGQAELSPYGQRSAFLVCSAPSVWAGITLQRRLVQTLSPFHTLEVRLSYCVDLRIAGPAV